MGSSIDYAQVQSYKGPGDNRMGSLARDFLRLNGLKGKRLFVRCTLFLDILIMTLAYFAMVGCREGFWPWQEGTHQACDTSLEKPMLV